MRRTVLYKIANGTTNVRLGKKSAILNFVKNVFAHSPYSVHRIRSKFIIKTPTCSIPIKWLAKYCSPLKLLANEDKRGEALEINSHNSITFNNRHQTYTICSPIWLEHTLKFPIKSTTRGRYSKSPNLCLFGNFCLFLHICRICISMNSSYTVEPIPAPIPDQNCSCLMRMPPWTRMHCNIDSQSERHLLATANVMFLRFHHSRRWQCSRWTTSDGAVAG